MAVVDDSFWVGIQVRDRRSCHQEVYFSVPDNRLDASSGDLVPSAGGFFERAVRAFSGPVISACSGELQVGK